jgi:site-specific DNA-adenine methylase
MIELSDGIEFLKKFNENFEDDNIFFYIDPPYHNAGKVLYRNYFNDKYHKKILILFNI